MFVTPAREGTTAATGGPSMSARDHSSDEPPDRRDSGRGGARFGRRRLPPLDERCRALVEELRERCPGVLPEEPLPTGQPGNPLPVEPGQFGQLVGLAARQSAAVAALGRVPANDRELPAVVIWEEGTAALAVGLARLEVAVEEGALAVAVPVWCDQLPRLEGAVRVIFVVGTPERPAGLLAATTSQPQGPRVVLDAWAEQLTALAWQAVLDTAAGLAAQAGTDLDGTPLVATALAAARDRLEILPQARHAFDRVLTGRAVTP
jgi:hypothetical protein